MSVEADGPPSRPVVGKRPGALLGGRLRPRSGGERVVPCAPGRHAVRFDLVTQILGPVRRNWAAV